MSAPVSSEAGAFLWVWLNRKRVGIPGGELQRVRVGDVRRLVPLSSAERSFDGRHLGGGFSPESPAAVLKTECLSWSEKPHLAMTTVPRFVDPLLGSRGEPALRQAEPSYRCDAAVLLFRFRGVRVRPEGLHRLLLLSRHALAPLLPSLQEVQ